MTLKHPDGSDPDARPLRRTFTAEFKARVLAEYESAPDSPARGAILMRRARELDEGRWWCSESTMYRILRAANQSGEVGSPRRA
jgi:hypothetical protein